MYMKSRKFKKPVAFVLILALILTLSMPVCAFAGDGSGGSGGTGSGGGTSSGSGDNPVVFIGAYLTEVTGAALTTKAALNADKPIDLSPVIAIHIDKNITVWETNDDKVKIYDAAGKAVAVKVFRMEDKAAGNVMYDYRELILVKPIDALQANTNYTLIVDKGLTAKNGRTYGQDNGDKDLIISFKTQAAAADPAQPAETSTPAIVTFSDINNNWAKESIEYLAGKGIINGVAPNKFEPGSNITRGQFIKILVGSLNGVDITKAKAAAFTDVKTGQWYTDSINWAAENGIVKGYDNGEFGLNDSITREQMAVMINNFANKMAYTLNNKNEAAVFNDNAKISAYAKDAVAAMQKAGIINGKPGNVFDPQGLSTRAEAAKMMAEMIKGIK